MTTKYKIGEIVKYVYNPNSLYHNMGYVVKSTNKHYTIIWSLLNISTSSLFIYEPTVYNKKDVDDNFRIITYTNSMTEEDTTL